MSQRSGARRRLGLVTGVFALAVTALVAAAGQPQAAPSAVVAWARSADYVARGDLPDRLLATRPADIPELADILLHGAEPQRIAAALALGYAGGDEAIAALQRANARGDRAVAAMLALALGARGTPTDRAFLVEAIGRGPVGQAWPGMVGAAHALGVLRATEATAALEQAAADRRTGPGTAAHDALRWIRDGDAPVEGPSVTDEDRIVAAAFRNGLPIGDTASYFNDEARGGVWVRDGRGWRFRAGARTADGPSLGFDVHMGPDRTRAVLSVTVSFGPRSCVEGYDYILALEGDRWEVRGIVFTWIS